MQKFKVIYKVSTGECDPNFFHIIEAENEAAAIKVWKIIGHTLKANMTINFIRIA